jgi:hypothetical protein
MASEMKGRMMGGPGRIAEIDGGYFGGYVKPANHKENRVDQRLPQTISQAPGGWRGPSTACIEGGGVPAETYTFDSVS